ncbi:MAG: hypothetical protein JST54_13040 [Deltaproteobacteria bacterium]|nr:hypothetical protein [Deltaproteobacteria bacterium]
MAASLVVRPRWALGSPSRRQRMKQRACHAALARLLAFVAPVARSGPSRRGWKKFSAPGLRGRQLVRGGSPERTPRMTRPTVDAAIRELRWEVIMGKAAMAAAAAVGAGMVAFPTLAVWLPAAWAECGALGITGLSLVGASYAISRRAATQQARPEAHEAPTTPQEAQEI